MSNFTSYKTKNKKEEQKHNPTSKSSFLKPLKKCHELLIIKNYCIYNLPPDLDKNLKTKSVQISLSFCCYFK